MFFLFFYGKLTYMTNISQKPKNQLNETNPCTTIMPDENPNHFSECTNGEYNSGYLQSETISIQSRGFLRKILCCFLTKKQYNVESLNKNKKYMKSKTNHHKRRKEKISLVKFEAEDLIDQNELIFPPITSGQNEIIEATNQSSEMHSDTKNNQNDEKLTPEMVYGNNETILKVCERESFLTKNESTKNGRFEITTIKTDDQNEVTEEKGGILETTF